MPGKPWIYEFEHAKLCILSVPRLLHLEAMGNEMVSVDPEEYALNLWDKGWEFDDNMISLMHSVSQASLYQ